MLRLFKKRRRIYVVYFQERPNVTVHCDRVVMRDGFFECINGTRPVAFYRCELVLAIDSNPA